MTSVRRRLGLSIAALVAAGMLAVLARPRLRTLLRRWAKVLGLGARTTARASVHGVRRLTAGPEERRELDRAFQLRSTEDVVATLGNMKGTFMKLGQILSFVDEGIPDHIRAVLAQLQDTAPPMSPDLAADVLRRELGAAPQDLFAHWDPEPLA